MLGHGPSTPKGPRCCLVRRRIITSTLVHASTDKVYGADSEAKAIAPESVYGQTKAAGDIAVANAPEHYILRRSESADSRNIVDTLFQLLDSHAEYGVYAVGD